MTSKTAFRFLFIISIIILLSGCSKAYDFAEADPFITAYTSPAGPDDYRNMYSKEVAIYQDGTLVLTTSGNKEIELGTDIPKLELKLKAKEIEELQKLIEEEDFLKLPEDASSLSEDGAFYGVTVNLQDETKAVSGLNPDDESFNKIHQAVFDLIPDKAYEEWRQEVEEQIWELNSLHKSEKTDYQTDGPFLRLVMEQGFSEGTEYFSYFNRYDLTQNGQLRVSVIDKMAEEIDEIPRFQTPVSESELKKIQTTLLENFWKLNESLYAESSGGKSESITVYLTEEEKKVTGSGVNHPRFVEIKDSIIKQLNPVTFSEWEEDVKKQLMKTTSQ